MDQPPVPFILASASARRAQLLTEHGYQFTIVPSDIEEPTPSRTDITPDHWAEAMSYFKARNVAKKTNHGIILGADTVVALGGKIFGKARDLSHARTILTALAGTTHRVITGLSLLNTNTHKRIIAHDVTEVTMKPMSAFALQTYLDSEQWQGKAGAYGIQDASDAHIEKIVGSYSNVVGLPMELLKKLLPQIT